MPKGAIILCVQVQGTDPVLWAEIDTEEYKTEYRRISLYETGQYIPDGIRKYIGTYQIGSDYVGHIYEEPMP